MSILMAVSKTLGSSKPYVSLQPYHLIKLLPRKSLVTAAAGLALILSGCGTTSDGGGSSTPSAVDVSAPTSSAPEANRPPVTVADNTTINQDTTASNFDVISNDSDPDGDQLSLESATVSSGSVSVNTNNTLSYTPQNSFTGDVSVQYRVSDGQDTSTGNATITVVAMNTPPPAPSNSAPVVNADSAFTNEDTILSNFDALANDSDPDDDTLMITSATASTGSVTVNNNTVSYTPPANYSGSVSITYTVSDGEESVAGNISVSVLAINDAPTVIDDAFSVDEDSLNNSLDVLSNDIDIDSTNLTITAVSANSGTAVISNGQIVYSPDASFVGVDNLSYTIEDPSGASDSGTAAVTVNAASTPINNTNLQAGRSVKNILTTPYSSIDFDSTNHGDFSNWTVVRQTNASISIASDNESVTFTRNTANDESDARAYIEFTVGDLWPDKDVSFCFEASSYSESSGGTTNVSMEIANTNLSGQRTRTATQNGIYCTVLSLSSKQDETTVRLGIGVTGNDTKTNNLVISKFSVSPTDDGLPNEFVKSNQRDTTATRSGIGGASFNYPKDVTYNTSTGLTSFSKPSSIEVGPTASHILSITDSFGVYNSFGVWYPFYGFDSLNVTPDYVMTMSNRSGRSLGDTNPTTDNLLDDMLAEAIAQNGDDGAPGVCWIAQGVNDFVVDENTAANAFTHLQAHVTWCTDNNMYPVIVTASPFNGFSGVKSGTSESERLDYNTLVRNYVTANSGNISLVDYDLLLDANQDGTLDAEYSLDGLHPNRDGATVLSEAAHAIFNQIIANAD